MPYNSVTNGDIVSNSLYSQIDGYAVEKYTWSTAIPPAMLTFALFSNNISCTERPFGKDEKPMRILQLKRISSALEHLPECRNLRIFFVPGQTINLKVAQGISKQWTLPSLLIFWKRIIDKSQLKLNLKLKQRSTLIRSFEGILNRDGVRRAVRLFLKHLWGENDETDYLDLNEMVAGNYTWSDIVKVLVGLWKRKEFLDSKGSEQNIPGCHQQENLTFVEGNTNKLILANPTATGYHRTFYEDSILLKIQNHLESNHGSFKPLARARLILDYFSSAEQTTLPPLNLTRYLIKEDSLEVWTAFLDKFTKLYSDFYHILNIPSSRTFSYQKLTTN
ncbi:Aminopeptidase-like protein AC3.5 [Orchesella cincta]|uniref:Aminopeptidase-like protein AC3.5 n=1 Tax=Orchesella cincta TaxID=48709 RepID=A0A1D2M9F2_ORCCI|nr:Aminopeptidase-like protein AC3.5 [Orchesella cincta]